MYEFSPSLAVIQLSTVLLAVAAVACSDDSLAPEDRTGFIQIDAWACPTTSVQSLTFAKCVKEGDSFDPTVADLPGRLSVLTVLVRPERPEQVHWIVTNVIHKGELIDARIFFPMDQHQGLRDVLSDTISIPPLPDEDVDILLELAVGERIPFLTLIADTMFHWE